MLSQWKGLKEADAGNQGLLEVRVGATWLLPWLTSAGVALSKQLIFIPGSLRHPQEVGTIEQIGLLGLGEVTQLVAEPRPNRRVTPPPAVSLGKILTSRFQLSHV